MTHVNNIIDNIPIYYINLNRSLDRKTKIEQTFLENNLKFKRVEGVDGKELNIEELKKEYNINPKLNVGEIGCALSHMKIIKEVLNDELEYALIMEDDCNFDYVKYKKMKLTDIMKINNDWDIIQLAMINDKNTFTKISNTNQILEKSNFVVAGAMGYLINKKGIQKILADFNKNKHIEVSEVLLFKNSNTYLAKPYFSYYSYKEVSSTIRENTKSAFTTQRLSKIWWDEYYEKN